MPASARIASDNRGGAGKAQRVVRLVAVIVVGKDMDVDIGGFHDAQMRLIGGRARSKGGAAG